MSLVHYIYLSTHIYNKYPTYTQHIVFDIKSKAGKKKQNENDQKKKKHTTLRTKRGFLHRIWLLYVT